MGLLDSIGAMAGDASQGDNAKVMGGFIQALQSHPEGVQGMLKSFAEKQDRNTTVSRSRCAFRTMDKMSRNGMSRVSVML